MNQDGFGWFHFVSIKFEWSVFCNSKITDSESGGFGESDIVAVSG